jgi:DNA-directed RNA polymerase sigma subunit (sigma70/sigma32)
MQELLAELTRPVALSDRAVRDLARIRRAHREHLETHGNEPTNDELSRATGLTPAQLESLQATERRPRAIEERLSVDGESTTTLGERSPTRAQSKRTSGCSTTSRSVRCVT